MEGACEFFKEQKTRHNIKDIEDLAQERIKLPQSFVEEANTEPISFSFQSDKCTWFHPATYKEFLELANRHPTAKIVHGNTELGIEMAFKSKIFPIFIYPADITSLKTFKLTENTLEIGAMITIADLQHNLTHLSHSLNDHRCKSLQALLDNIKWFAGMQVRNVSALAGNIVTASPISDLNPVWIALVFFY